MPDTQSPVEVFCSYAHADERWRKKLDTHLSMLKRQGLISTWSDRQISAGTDWKHDLDTHLNRASMILLLISPDFLASDFCYSVEMKRALERHQTGEARVIPILIRPVDWKGAPFAHLQALPTEAKPISAWSNKDTAFADVAAGIRRAIEDLSQLAISLPQSDFPPIWNVPLARNPFFTGREELLARLHTQLRAGQISALSQPQAISGLGGIGKTQLAIEYAYQFRQEYQAVLWARAESTEALTSSYLTLATLLKLPERNAQEQDITIQAVKVWLQTHQGWLLVLDNADEPDELTSFLPPIVGGHLLLTTRATALRRLGIAQPIEISLFSVEQGALFLLHRAGLLAPDAPLEQISLSEQERARQLSRELGGLPLALDQAGAYLEATKISLETYQSIYQQHTMELLNERRGQDHPNPVATTWALSFQRVEEKSAAAADLLRVCAFLAPDAIGEEILSEGAEELGPVLAPVATNAYLLGQAIETLRAYSLLERDPVTRTLAVHRLVQSIVRAALPVEIQRVWMQHVVLAVNATFPFIEMENWPVCERLLPHALLCASWIAQTQMASSEAARLLNQTAAYLKNRARYEEAEPLLQRALAIQEKVLGPEHPNTALGLNNLAYLYNDQGKYTEAEPLLQRALAIYEQALGPEHPDTATSLNNLAYLYYSQGKHTEAETLYQRALAIRERVLGPEHPDTAQSVNNLALIYYNQGKDEEAEVLYRRALAICEQVLGPEHPDTATSLNNLALFYYSQSKNEEAEALLQRALTIRERMLGPEHPDTATSLNNLADLYNSQNRHAEAGMLYQQALAIRERMLGPEHPDTATSLNNLAYLYYSQSRYAEAKPLLQQALATYERVLGPEHPTTRTVRANYFSLLQSLGPSEYHSGEA